MLWLLAMESASEDVVTHAPKPAFLFSCDQLGVFHIAGAKIGFDSASRKNPLVIGQPDERDKHKWTDHKPPPESYDDGMSIAASYFRGTEDALYAGSLIVTVQNITEPFTITLLCQRCPNKTEAHPMIATFFRNAGTTRYVIYYQEYGMNAVSNDSNNNRFVRNLLTSTRVAFTHSPGQDYWRKHLYLAAYTEAWQEVEIRVEQSGEATLKLDLAPNREQEDLIRALGLDP